MAIVYFAVADLLAKQGDLNGMAIWEAKGMKMLNAAQKIDDKKEGRFPRIGKPIVPIYASRGTRMNDYNER